MKTAISVPDALFRSADHAARRMGISRSELFARAVAAFLGDRDAHVTERLNLVYGGKPSSLDRGLARAQARAIGRRDG